MEIVFTYPFVLEEVEAGWRLVQRRWRKLDRLVRVFGGLNLVLAILGGAVLQPNNPGAWVLLLPAAYLLLMPWYRSMLFRRRLKTMAGFGEEVTWNLSSKGILISSKTITHQIEWDLLEHAVEGKQGVALRLSAKNFFWLPWASLTCGSKEELRSLLKKKKIEMFLEEV